MKVKVITTEACFAHDKRYRDKDTVLEFEIDSLDVKEHAFLRFMRVLEVVDSPAAKEPPAPKAPATGGKKTSGKKTGGKKAAAPPAPPPEPPAAPPAGSPGGTDIFD